MRQTLSLREPVQAHKALTTLWSPVKSMLMAGHRLVLEVRTETRSDKQNRMLHAMLGDISRQRDWPTGSGQMQDIETWKRLLTAAWCRARGEPVRVLPAIDGAGVDIVFRHTSKLTKGECAELCDFIGAWCSQVGVDIRGPEWVDQETGEITR